MEEMDMEASEKWEQITLVIYVYEVTGTTEKPAKNLYTIKERTVLVEGKKVLFSQIVGEVQGYYLEQHKHLYFKGKKVYFYSRKKFRTDKGECLGPGSCLPIYINRLGLMENEEATYIPIQELEGKNKENDVIYSCTLYYQDANNKALEIEHINPSFFTKGGGEKRSIAQVLVVIEEEFGKKGINDKEIKPALEKLKEDKQYDKIKEEIGIIPDPTLRKYENDIIEGIKYKYDFTSHLYEPISNLRKFNNDKKRKEKPSLKEEEKETTKTKENKKTTKRK